MTISFNQIAADIRTPGQYIEFDNSRAVQGLSVMPNKTVFIGQKLAAGTATASTPIQVPSAAKAEDYFGHGSFLAGAIEAYKAANPYNEVWAVPLEDDGGGTEAQGTATFTGPATADGTVYLYIGGHRITIAVSSGDSADDVATATAAAITAYALKSNIPVSAAVNGVTSEQVDVTCLHKGTLGNYIDMRLNYNQGEALPAGVGCTIVAIGTAVAGATDPDVATAITAVGDMWFNTWVSLFADDTNVDKIEAELLTRWGPMEQLEGHLFIGAVGNQSALTALGNARNNRFTTLMGGGQSPTSPWIWAAVAAAVDCGEPDPARPRQTLLLPGVLPPAKTAIFTRTERQTLLTDGVSTYTVGQDGNCYVERLITTYQTNALSVLDVSYLDITTMRTLAYLRYSLRARIALRFPRHKLAGDGTNFSAGQAVVTPSIAKSEILALFREWENAGLVEGFDQFKKDIIVERNASDVNRLDVLIAPDLMNQFRVFAGQIQFLL